MKKTNKTQDEIMDANEKHFMKRPRFMHNSQPQNLCDRYAIETEVDKIDFNIKMFTAPHTKICAVLRNFN